MFSSDLSHRARAATLPFSDINWLFTSRAILRVSLPLYAAGSTISTQLWPFTTPKPCNNLRQALFLPRLAGTLFGIFGFVGLALAAIGLYGVISYSVSRRTREIGIRIALGAQLSAVRQLILRQGMILTLIAMAIGLPAAFALAGVLSRFLYGIRPHDTLTFTIVPLFLATVAFLACWVPALRATRVDPQSALRYE